MSPSSLLHSFFESLGERDALVMEGRTKSYRDLVRVMDNSNPMADSIHDTVGVGPQGEASGTNEEPWTFIAALFRALSQHRAFDVGRRPQTLSGLWLQTTGTTGEPKSVHHAWDRWLAQYSLRDRGSSKILQVMALDHIGGLHSLFTALTRGMTVVMVPGTAMRERAGTQAIHTARPSSRAGTGWVLPRPEKALTRTPSRPTAATAIPPSSCACDARTSSFTTPGSSS